MKKNILITIIFLAVVGYIGFGLVKRGEGNCFVVLNAQRFNASVARTEAERQQGLSGTASLPQNEGKLFVFETPGMYGFWMKDMNYPIDIIWFDHDLKIVGLANNVEPKTYPNVFYPNAESLYVFEIGAGVAKGLNLDLGSQATIDCKSVLK